MSFLNNGGNKFYQYYNVDIFVDKSNIIKIINKVLNSSNEFLCITRPRRFGKTLTISMLNSYYSKGSNSKEIFNNLEISKDPEYLKHLNKHNVIWVDMSALYTRHKENFINEFKSKLIDELKEAYPDVLTLKENTIADSIIKINKVKGERFIFLIDEWDVIFREMPNSNLCDEYILLLRDLFKSSDVSECLDLVYMTGILPIKRYNTESALNMFKEYNMLNPRNLGEYIGFSEDEVKKLCEKYSVDFKMMKNWYDGYHLGNFEIYNPESVVEAINSKEFRDYWTSTGALESITNYMNYDNGELKETIALMLTGEKVKLDATLFDDDLTEINSKDAALTVLIHLGYLAFDAKSSSCYIPNYEIKKEFEKGIKSLKWNSLCNPILNSKIEYIDIE